MTSERIQGHINRLLAQADDALTRLDWEALREAAQSVLRLDPGNGDALAFLAAVERGPTTAQATSDLLPGRPESLQSYPPHPRSFVHGRYQAERFLGEGGKKRVYLAHDTLLDRDVAFALIKTEGLGEEGRQRITREVQAMAKLGDHPHIVPVFDVGGAAGGQFYLVTQFMPGGDVEGLLKQAPDHRLAVEEALTLAGQICQALEHAHTHGIVHRDLKPANVWLSVGPPAGSGQALTAKIGDFGLAMAMDRSRLTQAGMMVGTVAYMPPEQATGGEVTPRSDLYSLGCMLYEMLCGRPPFVGDDSVAVIGQHLNTPPVLPSWHRKDVPPGLEALILRLLEKDPAKRPGGAREVLEALDRMEAGHAVPLRDASLTSPADNPLYRRVFVGREAELGQLHAAFDAALSGESSLVMVVGEPGIGKTSLCEQLATYVALRGGKTLVGHCYEEGSLSLPYLPFVEGLRSYVLSREPDGLKQDLGSGASEVARIVSEVRDRVQVTPGEGGDPEEQRWRLLQAVAEFLRNASRVQPLLLVLEDLHDSDRGTLDLLLHLSRNIHDARLLLVGTFRDVEVDRAHPLSGALAELRRTAAFARIPLRGLTVDEVHRMMNLTRGHQVPWGRAEAIHRQTEGNPLFIQEMLRYLVEEGIVVRQGDRYVRPDGGDPDAGIPEGLRDVIGKRLSRLGQRANDILSCAAVIGREFRLDVLQKVAQLPPQELEAALEEATERAVIEQRQAVGTVSFRFTHAFFRQTLYEEIFIPRRIRWHQQVARSLEEVHARRLDEHAAELAEHFAQSTEEDDLRKALTYSELAAGRAMSVYAYGEAGRHLEQALKVQDVLEPENRTKRCDLLLALAEAMLPAEDPARAARGPAAEAFALSEAMGDAARAAHAAVVALDGFVRGGGGVANTFRTPEFQEWAARAERYAQVGTVDGVYADVFLGVSGIGLRGPAVGHRYLRRAIEQARGLDDNRAFFAAAGWAFSNLNALQDKETKDSLVDDFLRRPRSGARSADIGQCLQFAGRCLLERGDRAQAEAQWRDLARLAQLTRDATVGLAALYPDGLLALLDGRLEDAVSATEDLQQRAEDLGMLRMGFLFDEWSRALIYLGHPETALPRLDEQARNQLSIRALCLAHLGRAGEVRAVFERFTGITLESDESAIANIVSLLEAAVLIQDRDMAGALARRLAPLASHLVAPARLVSYARLLGGAARLLGDPERAKAYFAQAIEVCQKVRFRPEIALTHLELAELLLQHYPDERADALQHLDFAITEFQEMKMQPALERALTHKGLLGA